jgi:voltage-gated potassium channel
MKEPFVIIEEDPNVGEEMKKRKGYDVLCGDCTDEYVLKKANVEKAKGIICALGNNEENFYVLITARHFNPNIKVAARADSEDIGKKMRAVGADIIVTPEVVGGRKLATGLIELQKPTEP